MGMLRFLIPLSGLVLVMGCAPSPSAPDASRLADGKRQCFAAQQVSGFNAIGRIRIVQKPLSPNASAPKPRPRPLTPGEKAKLSGTVEKIEDAGLRASLERLGATELFAETVMPAFR